MKLGQHQLRRPED